MDPEGHRVCNYYCGELWIECDGGTRPGEWSAQHWVGGGWGGGDHYGLYPPSHAPAHRVHYIPSPNIMPKIWLGQDRHTMGWNRYCGLSQIFDILLQLPTWLRTTFQAYEVCEDRISNVVKNVMIKMKKRDFFFSLDQALQAYSKL